MDFGAIAMRCTMQLSCAECTLSAKHMLSMCGRQSFLRHSGRATLMALGKYHSLSTGHCSNAAEQVVRTARKTHAPEIRTMAISYLLGFA